MKRVALVTGGNRGLGLGTCRELARQGNEVVLGSRSARSGEEAVARLAKEGLRVTMLPLDLDRRDSIEAALAAMQKLFGRIDILVNNAGILPDKGAQGVLQAPVENMRATLATNVLGPFQLTQLVMPLMEKHGYGRIVNVSSGMGQLSDMNGGYPAYRVSKTALNALTKIFAAEGRGHNILVNSICPGWVRTDMGGPNAPRTIEEAAKGIVWAATLPDDGPTGGFFRDGKPIPW
jgi:NAD(P)-dependent dehydrogenase (short-subunit alcohol dehydrogenase family)